MKIHEALSYISGKLRNADIELPDLEAQILLANILNIKKYKLLIDNEKALPDSNIKRINRFIKRRIKGEPIAYITGKKEFFSIEFNVTKDVLIPRPETEQLVELAVLNAKANSSILDIGTGSGAIAIAIKKQRPDLDIYACDKSAKALKVANENAIRILGDNSVIFSKSDLFKAYKGKKFDLILSNPPYLNKADRNILKKDILFEPKLALFARDKGQVVMKRIITEAKQYLNNHGMLIIEIAPEHKKYIKTISTVNNYSVRILNDLALLPRVAILKTGNPMPAK